jgi:hypothetical protein
MLAPPPARGAAKQNVTMPKSVYREHHICYNQRKNKTKQNYHQLLELKSRDVSTILAGSAPRRRNQSTSQACSAKSLPLKLGKIYIFKTLQTFFSMSNGAVGMESRQKLKRMSSLAGNFEVSVGFLEGAFIFERRTLNQRGKTCANALLLLCNKNLTKGEGGVTYDGTRQTHDQHNRGKYIQIFATHSKISNGSCPCIGSA